MSDSSEVYWQYLKKQNSESYKKLPNVFENNSKINLIYIQSFIPSFVINELVALKELGISVGVIVPISSKNQKSGKKIQTGGNKNIIYVPDAEGIIKRIVDFLSKNAYFAVKSSLFWRLYIRYFFEKIIRRNYLEIYYLRRAVQTAWIAKNLTISRIHSHFAWGNAIIACHTARILNIPFSLTVHANDIFSLKEAEIVRVTWLFQQADKIITISDFNKKILIDNFRHFYIKDLTKKIRVIHCGIPTDLFTFRGPNLNKDIFRIATLPSGFHEKKGTLILLGALKKICNEGKKIECIIVGGKGHHGRRKMIEDKVGEMGLSSVVKFPGRVSQNELPKLYQSCHAFVLPCIIDSNGKMDGIPVSLMEAMAVGLPVISTKVSGIPELIEHNKTGLLAVPGDPNDLAVQLKRMMNGSVNTEKLIKAARSKIESDFDIKVEVKKLIKCLSLI